jgi:hypothetical protein
MASWINRPSAFRVLVWCFGAVLFVFALVPVRKRSLPSLCSLSIPFRIPAQTYGNTLFVTLLLFVGLALEPFRLKGAGRNALSG